MASSESNDLTNSENGIHSGLVKQGKLLDVALNSKVEKNNNKDSINSLVIIIFSITIRRYQMVNTMAKRKTNRRADSQWFIMDSTEN